PDPKRRSGDAGLRRELAPDRAGAFVLGAVPGAVTARAHLEPGDRGAVLPDLAHRGRRTPRVAARTAPGAHRGVDRDRGVVRDDARPLQPGVRSATGVSGHRHA